MFFDALKDGFFHCCVIVFSISDDFIVENVNLSRKKMSLSFLLLLLLQNKGHLGCGLLKMLICQKKMSLSFLLLLLLLKNKGHFGCD